MLFRSLTVGASDVTIFAGLRGGQPDELGLKLTGGEFALALMSEQSGTRSWTALQAGAEEVAFVGVEGLTVSADSISVSVNRAAADGTVVDFASMQGDAALVVSTGPDASIALDMDGEKGALLQASGNGTLDV